MSRDYMSRSREEWRPGIDRNPTLEELQLGTLQRIANATETMAKSYNALRDERDLYERWYKAERDRVAERDRSIAALRGQITKLRKRLGEVVE